MTPLRVEKIGQDGARALWRLLEPLSYDSPRLGRTVTVPAGFVTDFASVPRLPLAFLMAGDKAHEAAVVHDWLYTTHETDRATADAVFRDAIRERHSALTAALMWSAVRLGGGAAWDAPAAPQPAAVTERLQEAP